MLSAMGDNYVVAIELPELDDDEAIARWGAAAEGADPLVAALNAKPYSGVRPHIPFYRFLHYPDVLDLRKAGYELSRFIPLFDKLDDARYSQALAVHRMLHRHEEFANPVWNPRRAREIEFELRGFMHRHGLSDVPTLLRRTLGRAFPDQSISHLSIDLLNVFFWAALAEVARDYAWRDQKLSVYADYLSYPVDVIGFEAAGNKAEAA